MSLVKLIVGLGNPGAEYEFTRHNIGWIFLDIYLEKFSPRWMNKFNGEYFSIESNGNKIFFLKPLTFMNLSGRSVQALAHFFKIQPQEILVLHDEIDFDFGKVALKKGSGSAGHNGLKSITQEMGTPEYFRMRLGVGRPIHGSVSDWVLGNFSKDEEISLDKYSKNFNICLDSILKEGIDKTSQKYSNKNFLNI
jgi:PTH1 family peptidyl-tRNA hydrolase